MAAAATAPARKTTARTAAPARRIVRPVPSPRRPAAAPRRGAAGPRTGFVPVAVGIVAGIADSGLVLGLTRSRLWIGVLGTLLVGIVALNVMALSFNAQSSKTAGLSDELREANSALRADIADGLSNERLQTAAVRIGLVMPQAASALMLTPDPGDAEAAAQRLRRGDITLGSTYVVPIPEASVEPTAAVAVTDPAVTPAPTTDPTAIPTTGTPTSTTPIAPATQAAPLGPETGGGVTP
ncbi:MAG: hypothetical protein M3355_01005 [Actinomycetota bacterium]|nr:hypothetical protein [Actinomycetota bacterium]